MAMTESLKKRVVTALIGVPVVLGVIIYGGWPFLAGMLALFCLTVWEWYGMCVRLPTVPARGLFMAIGTVYFIAAFLAMTVLNGLYGLSYLILLLLMVWASDTVAYIVGKSVGGPKLCPKISPNKTWSGFAGAMLGPALVGFAMTSFFPLPDGVLNGWPYIAIGLLLGACGQAGDLLISAFKRRVQVKDTSNILPGHGGVLDRIDALLLVALLYVGILVALTGVPQ